MGADEHRERNWAKVILLVSGMVSVGHQLLWTRRLVDLLGASPETFAKVVGVFFLGLSAGSAWSAFRPSGGARAWVRVAMAEAVVGVGALGPLLAVDGFQEVGGASAWLVTGVGRWVLPLALIAPPAVAMGLVFPAVWRAMGRGMERAVGNGQESGDDGAQGVRLYAWNTLGGLAAIGGVFFYALPYLGMVGTGLGLSAANLGLAWVAWTMGRRREIERRQEGWETRNAGSMGEALGEPQGTVVSRFGNRWVFGRREGLALMSGYAVLAMEVIVQHQFAQVAINSHFAAAGVLAFVFAGLVVGAFAATVIRVRPGLLGIAACSCFAQPWLFAWCQPGLRIISYELPPPVYFLHLGILGLLAAVPMFAVAGMIFPDLLRERRTKEGPGSKAALLAINGLGGWLGAEMAQGVLMPRFGLWSSMSMLGLAYVAMYLAWERPVAGGWRRGLSVLLLGVAGMVGVRLSAQLPQVAAAAGETVVEVATGREGVVATVTGGTNDWRILFNNTYTLGGSLAQANQERQALLPLLLQGFGTGKRVALLGLATGSTTGGAALAPWLERIEAFELSPLVARMAERHFAPWNRGISTNARVRVVIEDARLGMQGDPGRWDVVVGDLFLPWRTGEGRLYTVEHFAEVRRSLKDDGLFCQWLPLFQLTQTQFEVILRTFRQVFGDGFAVRGDFYAEQPIVGLCAFGDGRGMERLDWTRIDEACRAVRGRAGGTTDPLLRHSEGIAMCLLGPLPEVSGGRVNTLGNAWIEWDAGRNIVGLRHPWFIGVPWGEWAREVHRRGVGFLPPDLVAAHDAGQFFLTLEIAVVAKSSMAANLSAQVEDRLPRRLRSDPDAAWLNWPGRCKPGDR
ncbi:MAG: hypothetical protein JNK85_28560 [Verrucomicrobiales bacterium]|nr:hypothetical protein [Verrucomicrobiales bacterium]